MRKRTPPRAVDYPAEQLLGASDGYVTMKEIQRVLSSCHSSQTPEDCSPAEAWTWVRLVVHKIYALGSYVKALHQGDLPSEDDAALMFAFLNAAVEMIVPAITTSDAS